MPAPLAVDKEQVRMLVLAVGVREAARQTGINENTVLDWSSRGNWLAEVRPTPAKFALPASMRGAIAPISPADALQNTLNDRHKHTKLGLSLFTARAARMASKLPKEALLANAADVKAVADIAGKVWPEQVRPSLRISMFAHQVEVESVEHPVIDAEQA